ncbi:MAG: ABC transporter permease [Acidobacteriota bacterium]
MNTFWQDLRLIFRTLMKKPGFTAIAVLTLALGIGANTAVFSIVDAVLLRPLPFPHSDRLVVISQTNSQFGGMGFSAPDFVEFVNQNQAFDMIAGWNPREFTLTGRDYPEQLNSLFITSDFLPMLGARLDAGRVFTDEEYQPGGERTVIISHQLWQRRFGSDLQIIGQTITLDQKQYTVVGILSPEFRFTPSSDLFMPLVFDDQAMKERDLAEFEVIARLREGMNTEQVQQDLTAIIQRSRPATPEMSEEGVGEIGFVVASRGDEPAPPVMNQGSAGVRLDFLRELTIRNARQKLFLFWGAVAFVLLIACANIANLLLARGAARQKEIAIRSALGASRWRLVRLLLTESALLALVGGACGLLLALWGVDLLVAASPENIPRLDEVGLDLRVIGFTFLVSLTTGVIFGLAPALRFSKPDLNNALKEGAATTSGFSLLRHHGLRSLLVVAEIALTLVLLVGAGLMIRSFRNLQDVGLGYEPENLLTFEVALPKVKYRAPHQVTSFAEQLTSRVESRPAVRTVSATSSLPMTRSGSLTSVQIEGHPEYNRLPDNEPRAGGLPPPFPGAMGPSAIYTRVAPNYFRAMGIPLKSGREFTERDNEKAPAVVIISETMARRYWPGEDPLGKRIEPGFSDSQWAMVIGVVGNVRHFTLEAEARPEMYFSSLQPLGSEPIDEKELDSGRLFDHVNLIVRAEGDPVDLAAAVRQQVWSIDPDQPILRLTTMEELLAEAVAPRRFNMIVFGVFASLAVALAAVGIYGVVSYAVSQRTREIGIRMALGAGSRDVLRLVISQGMAMAIAGVIAGLIAAFGLTHLIESLLFEVKSDDPATFLFISVLLTIIAFAASYIPARRAIRVDPVVALRYE